MSLNLYIIFGLLFVNCCWAILPDDILVCRAGDVDCVAKTTTEILNKNPNGRPDIGMPSIEPFHLNLLSIAQSSGLKIDFKDANIRGLSTTKIERAVGFTDDPETSKFELYGTVPKLVIKGKYEASGRVLILPITGNGDADIVFDNVKLAAKFKPSITVKDGKRYMLVKKLKVLMEPSLMKIQLTNLFNGDKALGDNMNKFLNENWKDVWTELSPQINDAITGVLKSIIADVFKVVTFDDLYKQ